MAVNVKIYTLHRWVILASIRQYAKQQHDLCWSQKYCELELLVLQPPSPNKCLEYFECVQMFIRHRLIAYWLPVLSPGQRFRRILCSFFTSFGISVTTTALRPGISETDKNKYRATYPKQKCFYHNRTFVYYVLTCCCVAVSWLVSMIPRCKPHDATFDLISES